MKKIFFIFVVLALGTGFFIFSDSKVIENNISSNISAVYQATEKNVSTTTILFFGDMMLDRVVGSRIRREGIDRIFENIESVMKDSDAVVANLEGVFTNNQSVVVPNGEVLRFTFDPALASELARFHFTHLSQANNHTNDFGRDGAEQSREIIEKVGIDWFGDYFNQKQKFSYIQHGDRFIVLFAYNQFSQGYLEQFLADISNEKAKGNIVIVMPHWGEEYEPIHSQTQEELARQFIDAGADMIVGAHPHVVQDIGEYKGKKIFYSLGNFVFDQEFSKETQEGLAVRVTAVDDTLSYELLPFDIIRSAPKWK